MLVCLAEILAQWSTLGLPGGWSLQTASSRLHACAEHGAINRGASCSLAGAIFRYGCNSWVLGWYWAFISTRSQTDAKVTTDRPPVKQQ